MLDNLSTVLNFPLSKKAYFTLLGIILFLSFVFATITIVPSWREAVRKGFLEEKRTVLAKAQGDLTGHGNLISVVKIKTNDDLLIEVYEMDAETKKITFRSRKILDEKRDGFFTYQGNATNLALIDVDGDGVLEIIAPTYDENLIPRLHVFRFDLETGAFSDIRPSDVRF